MKQLRWLIVLPIFAAVLLVVAGCASSARPSVQPVVETVVVERAVAESDSSYGGAPAADLGQVPEQRVVIMNGRFSLYVKDTPASIVEIRKVAEEMGGYVVTASTNETSSGVRGHISVRVPAQSFMTALDRIKALAARVQSENIQADDVTEEYVDLSARLRNLEATEKELLELLTTVRERTGKAEEIMAVYRELTNVRGQIEQIKGRMQYYERRSAMATIDVELAPYVSGSTTAGRWDPGRTLSESFRSLIESLQWLANAGIRIVVVVLPLLAIIALPIIIVVLIIRAVVRGRRRAPKS